MPKYGHTCDTVGDREVFLVTGGPKKSGSEPENQGHRQKYHQTHNLGDPNLHIAPLIPLLRDIGLVTGYFSNETVQTWLLIIWKWF